MLDFGSKINFDKTLFFILYKKQIILFQKILWRFLWAEQSVLI